MLDLHIQMRLSAIAPGRWEWRVTNRTGTPLESGTAESQGQALRKLAESQARCIDKLRFEKHKRDTPGDFEWQDVEIHGYEPAQKPGIPTMNLLEPK